MNISQAIKTAQSLEHLVQLVITNWFPQFKPFVDPIVKTIDDFFASLGAPPTTP